MSQVDEEVQLVEDIEEELDDRHITEGYFSAGSIAVALCGALFRVQGIPVMSAEDADDCCPDCVALLD